MKLLQGLAAGFLMEGIGAYPLDVELRPSGGGRGGFVSEYDLRQLYTWEDFRQPVC